MPNFWANLQSRKISFNSTFHQIIQNIGWLTIDKVLRTGIGVIVWIAIARYLGPEKFGLLNYCIAFVSILGTLCTLGANRIVIRELVNSPSERNNILGTITFVRFLASCIVFISLVALSSQFTANDHRTPILVSIIGLSLIFQSFDSIDFWYQSQVNSKYTVLAKSASFLICAIIKLYLVSISAPLITFAIVIAIEALLAASGLITIYCIQESIFMWRFKFKNALALLKESWPEAIAGISTLVFMRIDQVMLGIIIDTEAVGQYSAASRISEVLYFIPIIIVSSTFPAIISSKNNQEIYHSHLKKLFSTLAIISYITALFFTFTSSIVIEILYGEHYTNASSVLIIHAWTILIVSFGLISGSWIIAEKRAVLSMKRTLIGAVSNILLNILLIPHYGLIGAAVGTLVSQIIAYYLFDFFTPQMKMIFNLKSRAFLLLDSRNLYK